MNAVTKILREEHGLIGRAADCLERLAYESLETGAVPVETAVEVLEFFEQFADTAHQQKEERYLFPVLLDQGLAEKRLREFVEEHERERALLCTIRSELEIAAFGSAVSRDRFAQLAREYATLQREHADEEDAFLLPLVEEFMEAEAARRVVERFDEVDSRLLPRPREHYTSLVERAEAKLGSNPGTDARTGNEA